MDLTLPPPLLHGPTAALLSGAAVPAADAAGLGEGASLALLQAALAHDRLAPAAAALATALAQSLAVDRVFVGLVRRHFCQVVAVSHGAGLDAAQPLLRELSRAMDEAVDQGAHVAHPPQPGDRPRVTRAHAALALRHGLGALLTVPLFERQRAVGALVFERPAGRVFDAGWTARAQALSALLAPLLRLLGEHDRGVLPALLDRGGRRWQALAPSRRRQAMALVPLAVAAVAGVLAMPWTHRIGAPTRLEGRVQRAVVAPLDGYLKSVHVRAGDSVRAGQVMAELADDELRLELRRRQTELAQHESAWGDAMARQDRAALVQAESRAAESRAQLDLVQSQLARTRLLAPFDALVIGGDLQQRLAAPLKRGEPLFTLTPSRELRVMLQVDESDSAALAAGMAGEVVFPALPAQRFALVVERVSPVARAEGGRNGFEAEARLVSAPAELMRPGMQGLAQLDAGPRPLAWLLGHRALAWARLQWWRWVGG